MCCVVAAGPRACRDVSTMLYFHIYRIRVFFLLPFAYLHSNVSWGKANQLCVCSRYAANWGWSGEQLKAKARLLRWAAVHSFSMSEYREEWARVLSWEMTVFKMILHLPPHSPVDPSRQNSSTYLQERRDKKINDYALNYVTWYQGNAPFDCSRGENKKQKTHHIVTIYCMW